MVENLTIITSRVPYVNIFNHIPAQLLPVLLALGISLAPALYARMQLRGREGSTSVTIKPNVSQTSEPKTNSTRTWQKTKNHATHKTSIAILYLWSTLPRPSLTPTPTPLSTVHLTCPNPNIPPTKTVTNRANQKASDKHHVYAEKHAKRFFREEKNTPARTKIKTVWEFNPNERQTNSALDIFSLFLVQKTHPPLLRYASSTDVETPPIPASTRTKFSQPNEKPLILPSYCCQSYKASSPSSGF